MNKKNETAAAVQNNTIPNDNDTIEIDLGEVFLQLLAHWKLIFLCMILMGGLTYGYCRFLVTPQYASTAGLYVFSKSTSVTSLADLQIGSSLTTDYETVITGRPVIERVITRLKLSETYAQLRAKVQVYNPSDSRILYITVKDPNPERAKTIADRIAVTSATFISQKMNQDPPSLIQAGYSDGNPVSPLTKRNAVIGALLGFLLAAGYVILRYMLTDTIMTPEDAQKKLGIEILASLPLEEEEGGRRAKHSRRRKTA